MVKGLYQLPPCTRMELLHSNIWWSDGVELINKGFTYAKGIDLYRNGIQCVDDVWDIESRKFLTWDKAQEKFNLTPTEAGDWAILTDKISSQWRYRQEDDSETTYLGQ